MLTNERLLTVSATLTVSPLSFNKSPTSAAISLTASGGNDIIDAKRLATGKIMCSCRKFVKDLKKKQLMQCRCLRYHEGRDCDVTGLFYPAKPLDFKSSGLALLVVISRQQAHSAITFLFATKIGRIGQNQSRYSTIMSMPVCGLWTFLPASLMISCALHNGIDANA